MTVTLTPELERIVNAQLATGQFATQEEVIAAGLRMLQRSEAGKEADLRALLDEADEDVVAGRVGPFDPVATAARVKAALAARAESRS
ncbi:hypothetical protein GobsT_20860 [Gemmata obscuriglobus]|nr:type II toxin-antitoxin system ParD family antitoxin [Gemmata obscuriglobus]QEG27332.1 hypothetical protein GobsT_20860 [Gemmata obscuriglobus]VTS04179.1 : RHH_2 [Gemmata obscuriglobus UQM 2246]